MKADQCRMILYHLQEIELPDVELNDKFTVCTWQSGSEHKWMQIVREAFGDFVCDWTPEIFVERYASSQLFREDGFFFIKHGDSYVATAFAWQDELNTSAGILHWLTVLPEYQQNGLGRALTLHVLKYHRAHGKESVSLKTEVYRTAAINLYQDFGFVICTADGKETK